MSFRSGLGGSNPVRSCDYRLRNQLWRISDQRLTCHADGFGNRIACHCVTPLFDDCLISHAALNLFQYIRDQDACAAECWFAMADGGVGYDISPQRFCFHELPPDCALVIVFISNQTVSATCSPLHPAFGATIPLIPAKPAQS